MVHFLKILGEMTLKMEGAGTAGKKLRLEIEKNPQLATSLLETDLQYALYIMKKYPAVKKLFYKHCSKELKELREKYRRREQTQIKISKANSEIHRPLQQGRPTPAKGVNRISRAVKNINIENIAGKSADDKKIIESIFREIKKTAFEKYKFNPCGWATNEMIKRCLEFVEPKRIKMLNAKVLVICCICENDIEKIHAKGRKKNGLEKTISPDDGKNKNLFVVRDKIMVRDYESGWSHVLLKIDETYYDPTIRQYYPKATGIYNNKLPSFYIKSREMQIKDKNFNAPSLMLTKPLTPPKINKIEFYNTILELLTPKGNICVNDNYICEVTRRQQKRDLTDYEKEKRAGAIEKGTLDADAEEDKRDEADDRKAIDKAERVIRDTKELLKKLKDQ